MSLILLTDDIASCRVIPKRNTLVVVHPNYPRINCEGATFVDYKSFEADTRRLIKDLDLLVFVGLNKMISPSNRTKIVWEVVYNNTPELEKISVDTVPFLVDPWRIWFHFGAIGKRYLDYTYSYIAESHYNSFIDGYIDTNPFALDVILAQGSQIIKSTYPCWFHEIEIHTIPMPDYIHAEYQKIKQTAFEKESTLKGILRRLGAFAQSVCADRTIPVGERIWKNRNLKIIKTDLRIDDFLESRIREIAELTNSILRGFYGQHC